MEKVYLRNHRWRVRSDTDQAKSWQRTGACGGYRGLARADHPKVMGIQRLRHGGKKHERNADDRQRKSNPFGSRKLRFAFFPTHLD